MPEINLEQTVLKNLITNEEFTRKVVKVTEAEFTYVAIDERRRPRAIPSE